jgi:hypothetical protein
MTAGHTTDGAGVVCMVMTLRIRVTVSERATCKNRQQAGEDDEQRNQPAAVGQHLDLSPPGCGTDRLVLR